MGVVDPMQSVSGNIVDVVKRRIFSGTLTVSQGRIAGIARDRATYSTYIIPGFIDSHIHIESSMLVPSEFARIAAVHGTVGAVCDPHEIANVMGMEGIRYMMDVGEPVPFK